MEKLGDADGQADACSNGGCCVRWQSIDRVADPEWGVNLILFLFCVSRMSEFDKCRVMRREKESLESMCLWFGGVS